MAHTSFRDVGLENDQDIVREQMERGVKVSLICRGLVVGQRGVQERRAGRIGKKARCRVHTGHGRARAVMRRVYVCHRHVQI